MKIKSMSALMLSTLLFCCAHKEKAQKPPEPAAAPGEAAVETRNEAQPEKTPAWLEFGSGPFYSKSYGRAFFGVGRSVNADKSQLRGEAESQARAEIASSLKAMMMKILEGYTKKYGSPTAEEFGGPIGEYAVSLAKEAKLEGSWTEPKDGACYAMCVLALDELKRQFSLQRQIEKGWRDYILGNIDVEFKNSAK